MAGQVVVGSNLVLNQVDVGDDVVLSAVESTGLDGGVHIALGHGNTVGAAGHGAHHLDAGVGAHNTDLQALGLLRGGDGAGLLAGVEVTGAQGVVGQDLEALRLGLGIEIVQLAGLEDLLLVLDAVVDIGGAEDGEVGNVGLNDGVGNQGHVQGAHDDLLEGLSLVAQLRVGINLEGVAAFGGLIQLVADPVQSLGLGVGGSLVEGHLENGGVRGSGGGGGSSGGSGSGGGSGGVVGAAGAQREDHSHSKEQCNDRFRGFHSETS